MIAISPNALNSPKFLLFDDERVRWVNDPGEAWVLGDPGSHRSIEALMETASLQVPPTIPEEFARAMEGLARGAVPWPLIIPQHVLGEHVRSISSAVDDAFEIIDGYSERLSSSRLVLSKLQPCRVDLAALRVEQGRSTTSILDSFEPGPDFMCQPPVYSHATATGRLTVKEGPRILTLQKEHRRILSSRFDGGRMMQIDFVSLEPRVLRLLAEGSAPIDIYSDVSERLGGAANRRQVKLATLKMLYGSGRAGINEELGSVSSRVIKQIEDYFGLGSLRGKLSSELAKKGSIRNLWGRPLPEATEQHLLISHFTQSTAVDVALGSFGDMIGEIERHDLDVVPCYVLHDALLVDVHPGSLHQLEEIVRRGVDVDDLGHFELSLSPAYIDEGAS
jgi:hypothetical protein